MKNDNDFQAYIKALFEAPITIIFVVLDIIGAIAFFAWVVDDWTEGLVVLGFILVLHVGHYLVFKKQRDTIRELSHQIETYQENIESVSLNLLDHEKPEFHLSIKVPPVPPEPNYDKLVNLEEDALEALYKASEKETPLSQMTASAFSLVGGKKSYKIYKEECDDYLKTYRNFLEKKHLSQLKKSRLRPISFQVSNDGKKPLQDVVIVINFPEELHPLENDDLYTELVYLDEYPKPPERPNLIAGLFPILPSALSYLTAPITHNVDIPQKNVRGPYISNGRVEYEIDKLMHNFNVELDEVFLLIHDEHIQRFWHLEYSIHATELPQPKSGTLTLEIQLDEE